jgi:lysophospholipase L1-like esterase
MPRISLSEFLKRIGLVLAATVFALLVGEGLVRALGRYDMSFPYVEDWNGITAGRPGAHGRHRVDNVFDVSVSFNQQRFRGAAETNPEPAPGVLRIATLGDSFTMGWGAEDDQAYPARLQVLLQLQLGHPVEVLNAGVGGTGTGEQALYYQRWVGHFHPAIVVLGVNASDTGDDHLRELFAVGANGVGVPRSPEAIFQSRRRFRQFRALVLSLPGFDLLDKHSRLFGLVRNAIWDLSHRRKWTEPDALDGALHLTAAEIRWLDGQVRESGGRLFVVYMPQRQAVYPPATEDEGVLEERLAAMLQDLCAKEQIPFSDLTPAMRAEAAHSPQPIYYTRRDLHPTPQGYAVFAQQVAELIGSHLRSRKDAPAPRGPEKTRHAQQ